MRDYAKKTSRPVKKKNNVNSSWILTLLITGAVFFVGYASYHVIHKKLLVKKEALSIRLASTTPIKTTASHPNQTIKKTAAKTEVTDPISNEPKYDFYKILPAMTVTIPTQDEPNKQMPSTTFATTANKAETSGSYVLQIASLHTSTDADQVSNALRASGYVTFIQRYQASDHTTWYRVMVGPFNTIKEAEAEQSKLYAHQTEALLLKVQR